MRLQKRIHLISQLINNTRPKRASRSTMTLLLQKVKNKKAWMFLAWAPASQVWRMSKTIKPNLLSLKTNMLTVSRKLKTTHRMNQWRFWQMEFKVQWKTHKRYTLAIPKSKKGNHLWLGTKQQRIFTKNRQTNLSNNQSLRSTKKCSVRLLWR